MSDTNGEIEAKNEEITPSEAPVVETKIALGAALQKRLNRRLFIASLCLLICGAVGAVVFIVLDAYFGGVVGNTYFNNLFGVLAWGAAVICIFGTICLALCAKNATNAKRLDFVENRYRFLQGYVIVESIYHGESVGSVKYYYELFTKVRETKEFFLLYPNRTTIYPVDKLTLTEGEIAALRALLPMRKR